MFKLSDKFISNNSYTTNERKYEIYLDANESFIPLPNEIMEEMIDGFNAVSLNRYPDPMAAEVSEAFAKRYDIPLSNVVAGNGSDELISLLFATFMEPGENFATISPDFSMYEISGRNSHMNHISIEKNADFTIDVDRVITACRENDVKLLIFSNPCNPTSVGLSREKVLRLAAESGALVVADEAYMEFWDESVIDDIPDYENLLVLKTCSKAFGLAGIRLGFAIANEPLINAIKSIKSPYNVNSISQVLGKIILLHKNLTEQSIRDIISSREDVERELLELSAKTGAFKVINGVANFVTLVMDSPENFHGYLADCGIAVRLTSGLVRITAGTKEENESLLAAARKYFAKE